MIVRLIELKPKIFNCKNIQQRAGVTIRKTALQKKNHETTKRQGHFTSGCPGPSVWVLSSQFGCPVVDNFKKNFN